MIMSERTPPGNFFFGRWTAIEWFNQLLMTVLVIIKRKKWVFIGNFCIAQNSKPPGPGDFGLQKKIFFNENQIPAISTTSKQHHKYEKTTNHWILKCSFYFGTCSVWKSQQTSADSPPKSRGARELEINDAHFAVIIK